MSGPGSATMHESPAGVAQLAERPSCKRQVSGSNPLTGSGTGSGSRQPASLPAMSAGDERQQEVLAKQLAMNQQTWAALQQRGVTEDTELRL
jgi:hypothetical protein